MPEIDDFGVLEQLAVDPALRDLPVIVTSSLEGVVHVARCIELGADDYLHKPVNAVLLNARVASSLEKKRLRDQQQEQVKRFATSAVAQDLAQSGFSLGGRRVQATVMFSVIRSFTALVESQPPEETIELLKCPRAPKPAAQRSPPRLAASISDPPFVHNFMDARPCRKGSNVQRQLPRSAK